MAQQKIQGVITGNFVDSTGRTSRIVQPLDGSLSAFVYGMPSARDGGPKQGETVDLLLIPGTLARNFTYLAHQATDVTALWDKATVATTGARTVTAAKDLSAEDKAARAALRAGFAVAPAAPQQVETADAF